MSLECVALSKHIRSWIEFLGSVPPDTAQVVVTVLLIYWIGYMRQSLIWIILIVLVLNFALSRRQRRADEAAQSCKAHFQNAYLGRLKQSFPIFEECQVANQLLASIWPRISSYARGADLFSIWDPLSIFDDLVDSRERPTVELGDIPARICGVRFLSPDSDSMILDIQCTYHGNAKMTGCLIKYHHGTDVTISSITAQFILRICMNISSGEIVAYIAGTPEYDFSLNFCTLDLMSNYLARETIMSRLRTYINSSFEKKKWVIKQGNAPTLSLPPSKGSVSVRISSFRKLNSCKATISMIMCRIPETTFTSSEDQLYEKTGEFRHDMKPLEVPILESMTKIEIVVFILDSTKANVQAGQSEFHTDMLICLKNPELHDSLIVSIPEVGMIYLDITYKAHRSAVPPITQQKECESDLQTGLPAKEIATYAVKSSSLSTTGIQRKLTRIRNFLDIDQERFEIRLEMISAKDINSYSTRDTPVYAIVMLERQISAGIPETMQMATKTSTGVSPIWNQILNFGIWGHISTLAICIELWNNTKEKAPTLMDSVKIDLVDIIYSSKFHYELPFQTLDFDRALSRTVGSVQFLLHFDRQ